MLFENPYFMNMYCKRFISNISYGDDTYLLLKKTRLDFENHSFLYLFPGERFDNKDMLDWPPPFQNDDRDINILGSGINGTLCLYVNNISSKVVLWNPEIEEFKAIPHKPSVSVKHYVKVIEQLHGFGYDFVRDDYKIIRYVEFYTDLFSFFDAQVNVSLSNVVYDPVWEIYSLKSNFWRKLDLDMTTFYRSPISVPEQVCMKGVCH